MHSLIHRLVPALFLAVALLGCGSDGSGDPAPPDDTPTDSVPAQTGVPERAPDVAGVLAFGDGAVGSPHLQRATDGYYEGMNVLLGDPIVVDADGDALDRSELADGDGVEVWIDGACAESFPVQCRIAAVRVESTDSG